MGGEHRHFPSTRWSVILQAGDRASPDRLRALEELTTSYWKPVYAYIRASRSGGNEDAKDLTQQFFEMILRSDFLKTFSPEKGSFRSYVRGSIRKFLNRSHRDATTLKRGGGRTFISLDDQQIGLIDRSLERKDLTPDEVFDREWANSVLDQALIELREELDGRNRGVVYQVYERFELDRPAESAPTYADLAKELGLKPSDVSNHLTHCRRRLRELIVERIRDTVDSEEDAKEEFLRLFA